MIKKIHLYLFVINLCLTIPMIYMVLGLPLVFAQQGWSGSMIGIFLLSSLPVLAKFILTYPIEKFRLGHSPYTGWALLLTIITIILLIFLSWHSIMNNKILLFILMLLANLFISWAEIPVNTLAIQILPEQERLRAGSFRSAAMSFSAIIGGGVLLLVQQKYGWSMPFFIMVSMLIIAIICLIGLSYHERKTYTVLSFQQVSYRQLISIFNKKNSIWLLILFLWFALIATVWTFLKPLLLSYGMNPKWIAITVGLVGGTLSAISGLFVPVFFKYFDKVVAIKIASAIGMINLLIFNLLLIFNSHVYIIGIATVLIALTLGMISALVFRLMMDFVKAQQNSAFYGMQSAIFQSGRIVLSVLAGIVIGQFNYIVFLSVIFSLSVLLHIFIVFNTKKLQQLFSLKE